MGSNARKENDAAVKGKVEEVVKGTSKPKVRVGVGAYYAAADAAKLRGSQR